MPASPRVAMLIDTPRVLRVLQAGGAGAVDDA